MVDHHVLNLKMLRKSLPVKLPKEFINLSDGSSLENPRNPPLWDRERRRWSRGSGASEDWQIEESGLKETLVGTSESKGTPLTLKVPLDKSKYLLGIDMNQGFQRRKQREKAEQRITENPLKKTQKTRVLKKILGLMWRTRSLNQIYIGAKD